MLYLLDTNIVIHMVRGKRTYFEKTYDLFNPRNKLFISAVTIGEMRSFAFQRNWGRTKLNDMEMLLNDFFVIEINVQSILNRYAEIDAFSKSKLVGRPLMTSSRTMGKNDIWIAATASVTNATLLTTDQDFDHLHNEFIQLQKVDNQLIV
jgi:tRNA(fMet)-specific endonuclease VapC